MTELETKAEAEDLTDELSDEALDRVEGEGRLSGGTQIYDCICR